MSNKKIFIIIIIIIIIIAVILGIFNYQKYIQKYNFIKFKSGLEVSKNGREQNEIVNWQTYKNEEYGFEISFPKDLFFRGGCALWRDVPSMIDIITLNSPDWEKMRDEPIGGAYSEDIRITFEKITKYGVTTINELIEQEEENDPNLPFFTPFVPEGKITIADREAYEIVVCGYGCEYTIFIEKDGYLYKIAFTKAWNNYEDLSEIERQILSTFKFID